MTPSRTETTTNVMPCSLTRAASIMVMVCAFHKRLWDRYTTIVRQYSSS
jgi:hypothetical protein